MRCFVKGAPDVLIARGGSAWTPEGGVRAGTQEMAQMALQENERMAKAGERVMVVGRRDFDPATFDPKGPAGDGTPHRPGPRADSAGDGRHRRSAAGGG